MDKLHINNEMAQFDLKNRGFYDELSDDEKKKFSTYLMLKYGANVEGNADLQEWYLRATNERVNINFFDLGKHPKLQWLLCTTVSPNMGKFRHYWQAAKKKDAANGNKKIVKFLEKLYPHMKMDEIEMLAEMNDVKDMKELAKSMGMTDEQIKKDLG
jgi:(p)ppGpp synthase/HD superfamily hydrolase